jgi:ATP-dependent Lon protease
VSIHIPSAEGEAATAQVRSNLPDALPVLPLRESVPFPEALMPLAIGQERSIRLVNDVLAGNRMLVMVASRLEEQTEDPGPDDLYRVGVAGVVARMLKVPDGTLRILVHGAQRVVLERFAVTEPYLVARIQEAPDEVVPSQELEALHRNVQTTFSRIIEEAPYLPEELQVAVANLDDPSELAHMIGGALRLKTEEKQALLEERNVTCGCCPSCSRASWSWLRSARASSRRCSRRWTGVSASGSSASS